MSYGVEFINDYGENVLRSSGLFFEKSSGTMEWTNIYDNMNHDGRVCCVMTIALGINQNHEFAVSGSTSYYGSPKVYHQTFAGSDLGSWELGVNGHGSPERSHLMQYSTATDLSGLSLDTTTGGNDLPKAIPNTVGVTTSDFHEVFFKLNPNGLHHFGSAYNPFNWHYASAKGLTAWCQGWWEDGEGQEYKVVGTPPPAVSGSYGIKVQDGSSNTVYDSRYVEKAVRIKDHIHVPKADIDDVLNNNAVKYYPLRQNVNNPWIGGDTSSSVKRRYGFGTSWWCPRFQIERINGVDNLKISCTRYKYKSGSSSTALPHDHSNPGTYLIADM